MEHKYGFVDASIFNITDSFYMMMISLLVF